MINYNSILNILYIHTDIHGQAEVTVDFNQNVLVDSVLATFTCPLSGSPTFSINSYNPSEAEDYFSIDKNTGTISLITAAIDISPNTYTVIAQCELGGNYNFTTYLFERIEENEFAPEFNHSTFINLTISENFVNLVILNVNATDNDLGTYGDIAFSLSGHQSNTYFQLDSENGALKLANDVFNSHQYNLTITAATDNDPDSSVLYSATVTVTVFIDHKPRFEFPEYETSQPETGETLDGTVYERPDTGFITVNCTDQDSDDDILSLNLTGSDSSYFSINEDGEITAEVDFDYDSGIQFYQFFAVCADDTGYDETIIQIVVSPINEHSPFIGGKGGFETGNELDFQKGTTIASTNPGYTFQIIATDGDAGEDGKLTFSLVGIGSGLKDSVEINSTTGDVYIVKSLDTDIAADSVIGYLILGFGIEACDPSVCDTSATFSILVSDSADELPQFTQSEYFVSFDEGTQISETIVTVVCSDHDALAGKIESVEYYYITNYIEDFFLLLQENISDISGESIQSTFLLQQPLDFETDQYFNFSLACYDDENEVIAEIYIAVTPLNDLEPYFSETTYRFNVSRTTPEGSYIVGQVTAFDDDLVYGSNLTYSIDESVKTYFTINEMGNIILIESIEEYPEEFFVFFVYVHDDDNTHQDKAAVFVELTGGNYERPQFTGQTQIKVISELQLVNSLVLSVYCNDSEDGNNGIVSYDITSGNIGNVFTIDNSTGDIFVANPLILPQGESVQTYVLELKCTDHGIPPLSDFGSAIIRVLKADIQAPDIKNETIVTFVDEDEELNTLVVTITAIDFDTENLVYFFQNESKPNAFVIAPSTGEVTVNTALDRETVSLYTMIVFAEEILDNEFGVVKNDSAEMFIYVRDVNDNFPTCSVTPATVPIEDTIVNGTTIYELSCTDEDVGINGNLTYTINNDYGVIGIDKNGLIYLKNSLNNSNSTTFNLLITISDQGVEPKSIDLTILVIVLATNDYVPIFLNLPASIDVGEDTSLLNPIFKVNAEDLDRGLHGVVRFELQDESSLPFILIPNTGELYLSQSLDYYTQDEYQLNISASDPQFSVYETLTVNVLDINEFSPECISTLFTKSIAEGADPSGVETISLGCTDEDKGSNGDLVYKITSGNINEDFTVSSEGSVSLNNVLDYESTETYTLEILVSDSGSPSKEFSVSIRVTVLPVNEHTPQIPSDSYFESIFEGTDIGDSVFSIDASDDDNGVHGELNFRLDPLQTDFGITDEGILLITGTLNREKMSNYSFSVIVEDGGLNPKSSTAAIEITILDEDDNPPSFTQSLYTYTVSPEEAVRDGVVATVKCTDPDENGNAAVAYSLISNIGDSSYFAISNTGNITISNSLPVSSIYSFGVSCSGVLNSNFTDTAQVSITILINSNITFLQLSYLATLKENADTGVFLTVNATSITNTPLTYQLVNAPSIFQILDTSGDLMLVGSLDYEMTESYILQVQASDEGMPPNMGTVAVNIVVENVNDEVPVFVTTPTTITITEEESNYLSLGTYKCTDEDAGSFGEITYTIASGNTDDAFSIDEDSGEILLANSVDYEKVQSLSLQIRCADGGIPAKADTLLIPVTVQAVNEFAPMFTSTIIELSVDELVPIPTIITVSNEVQATDSDFSPHNSIWYSIIKGNDDNVFYISPTSGVLTVIKTLDFEIFPSYTLTVMADDSGGISDPAFLILNSTVEVEITVTDANDHSPMFEQNVYVGSIEESAQVDDQVDVEQLLCTDEDSGSNGNTVLSIVDGDDDDIFAILTNGKIELNSEVDFETNSVYTLTIRCSDQGSPVKFVEAIVIVNIEDHSEYGPVFEETSYEFFVNETSGFGYVVGRVLAVDADTGSAGEIEYSASIEGPFAIDPESGIITVSLPLDYEEPPTYFTFNVTASDSANSKDITIVAINIVNLDDNFPNIPSSNYYGTIRENSDAGTSVSFGANPLSCSDPDDDADGIPVIYNLVSDDPIPFSILDDGTVTSVGVLDLEELDRYTFTVFCSDSGGSNTSAIVTIDVTPFNDFAPKFLDVPYIQTITEGLAVNTVVFDVNAVDEDEVSYNEITFGISDGNEEGNFAIDTKTGIVRNIQEIDYEEVSQYTLEISATNMIPVADDSGSPSLSSTTELIINITDINDNDPVLSPPAAYVLISDEDSPGFVVVTMSCEDADSGDFGETKMSLTGPNTDKFELLDNGTIITKVLILKTTTLQVNCSDMGSPPRYTIADITVATDSSNDYFPEFPSDTKTFTIYENHTVGDSIGCFEATDEDGVHNPNGILTYTLTLQDGFNDFTVDDETACIFVANALDYDDEDFYIYKLRATDGGVPQKFDEATISIIVQNVVFDPPQFIETLLSRNMSEGTPAGAIVTDKATCTDRDNDDVITYEIVAGNDDSIFAVNATTGEITLANPLDYETDISHIITLRCIDSSDLYDEAFITISVSPVNEHTPQIVSKVVSANEQSPVGTPIAIIEYSDADTGIDGQVTFTIISEDTRDLFLIADDTIYFNAILNREEDDYYPIELEITDSATLPKSSKGFVNVSLSDINDNAPTPAKPVYVAKEVNATAEFGYLVEDVNCSDDDIGINAEIIYSIEDNPFFDINSTSGEITVKGDLRDREKHTIALDVFCSDKGNPIISTSFPLQVPVNDFNLHAPIFLENSYSASLPENYNLSISFLNVTATDKDIGLNGRVKYSLLDDFDNQFYIDSQTGEISLLTELDFETIPNYVLTAQAIDGNDDSPMRRTGTVNISVVVTGVNEHTPICKQPIYTVVIEEMDIGVVLKLNCTDLDDGIHGDLSYSIAPGKHSSYFNVTPTGGVGIQNQIAPNASIEIYEVTVIVSDMGDNSKQTAIEINFIYSFPNLFEPIFNKTMYFISVSESTSVGEIIDTVLATDKDPGLQGQIQYSVEENDYFRVNPNTGELFVAEELDWETNNTFSFIVFAEDSDPLEPKSNYTTVSVTVLDENDNSPQCSKPFYTIEISSTLEQKEIIFSLEALCSDMDGPENSILSYEIQSDSIFNINSTTGEIYVNSVLTPGISTALTVTITDNGSPSLSTSITVSVLIRFNNIQPPSFTNTTYAFSVLENADLLTVLGVLVATDNDSSTNDLKYSLLSTEYGNLFYLDPQFGELILTAPLDYESTTEYNLIVNVEDAGGYNNSNVLSDTASVVITIINVNDHTPVLNNDGLYGAIVNKTTPVNEVILTIECTDDDLSPYGNPNITKHDFNSNVPFELMVIRDNESWEVRVSTDLTNLNGSLSYNLNFTCSDEGGESVFGLVFLSIPELDAPVFSETVYEWEISEDTESGETFTQIQAESQDGSDILYEIIDGNVNNIFYINPDTGVVSLAGSLDYETQMSYGLVIKATDGHKRESTVLLLVYVLDVDDNIPLVPPSAFLQVEQYRPIGYPVGQVECVDEDYVNASFSFNFVQPSDVFTIDNNGILRVNSTLDTTPVYVLPVACYDLSDTDIVSTGIITVQVVFVNLYKPEFDLDSYSVSVAENVDIQSLVTIVHADDDDIGSLGQVSFSIIAGNPDKFYVDSTSGEINVLTALDREVENLYVLTVEAVDGGIGVNDTIRKTSTTTVTIHILDINDNPPLLNEVSYAEAILTNHTVLSPILQVQCEDPDLEENGTTSYSIQPSHDSFIVDDNGTILLATQQSIQIVHNFYIYCEDMSSVPLSSSSLVTISVNKVEIGDPVFAEESYSVTIPENKGLLDPFLTVQATISDEDVDIVYSIIEGNIGEKFYVNPVTGDISIVDILDYNILAFYTLAIQASTTGFVQYSSQVIVSVTVEDVNDHKPFFTPLPYYTATAEENDEVLTPVVKVNCSDEDPTDILSYAITDSTPSSGVTLFDITDDGLVIIDQSLDYETTTVFTLTVECSDGLTQVEATVRIDIGPVNEYKPVFTESVYEFDVNENEPPGVSLGYINATDADSGIHGELTYLLQDPANQSAIFIDPSSGNVIVSNLLDYEVTSYYNLSVIARDYGGSESYVPVEITVLNLNDVPPVLTPAVTAYDGRVLTTSPQGLFIESYTCIDEDGSDTAISILSGNEMNYFALNSFNQLVWNSAPITLSSDIVVSLMLECIDTSNETDTASIAIVIGPPGVEPPTFLMSTFAESVSENTTEDTVVLTVSAEASLPNHTIEYSFFNLHVSFPFAIDNNTGEITVSNALDFETTSKYTFPVQAKDVNDQTIALATVEITVTDINDNKPMLLPSTISLVMQEDALTGISYAKFSCTDLDQDENGDTSFMIYSGDPNMLFSITESTGYVYLQNSLDFEDVKDHNITIICIDGGSPQMSASATLTVTVIGINEHYPNFTQSTYSFSTNEEIELNSLIGSVHATDEDDGINGEFYYDVYGGTGSDFFRVDSSSGQIYLKDYLNASITDEHTLIIAAVDSGPPSPLISTVLVDISIEDINDPPYFDQLIYLAEIATDIAIPGDSLGTITCLDYDLGYNAEVTLSIIQNDELFNNVSLTGKLVGNGLVSSDLVLNTTILAGSYEVIIQCADSGDPSNFTDISFIIAVEGVNTAPVFDEENYGLSIHEDTEVSKSLLTVHAEDLETDLTYAITGGTGLGIFTVDENTGVISLLAELDFETVDNYKLIVSAIDQDNLNPQTGTAEVSIVVVNVNDNEPTISPPSISAVLNEGDYSMLEVSTAIFTCKDLDEGLTSLSITPSPPFFIDEDGQVTFTGTADYESNTHYTVTITCIDTAIAGGDLPKSSTGTLAVSIIPVNFFAPVITSDSLFSISESSEVASIILSISAYDPDMRGTIGYSTDSNTDVFSLDSATGDLVLLTSLDRETLDTYTLTIEVSDNDNKGEGPKTSTTTVTLSITDVNDNSPNCDVTLENIVINEDMYNDSISIFNASCFDEDIGNNSVLEYSIEEDSLPGEGIFELDPENGELTLTGVITKDSTGTVITIIVTDLGTDPVSNPAEIQLILSILTGDEPRFEPDRFSVNISESFPALETVIEGTVFTEALLNAEGEDVTFDFSTNTTQLFLIDYSTGNIILLAAMLDYDEGQQQYSLGIQATVGTEIAEAILDVIITDYNDNPPEFSQQFYNGSVTENKGAGEVALIVSADDIDSGENGEVRYSITSSGDNFKIDAKSGEITTLKTFDREVISVYSITIVARDLGTPVQSSSASVNIEIGDVNDNPPKFTLEQYVITISDNSKAETILQMFSVNDPDEVGIIRFALKDEGDFISNLLEIDPVTGNLRQKITIPSQYDPIYTFKVTANDEIYTDETTVVLQIATVSFIEISWLENENQTEHIFEFLQLSHNISLNAEYIIISGDDFNQFEIIGNGILINAVLLDRENISHYTIDVLVIDNSTAENFIIVIDIDITDANDNIPMFESDYYQFNISEGQYSTKTPIGSVKATDNDEPNTENSRIEYTLSYNSGGSKLDVEVDVISGEIRVFGKVDREDSSVYDLVIKAEDNGEPAPFSDFTNVQINVADINDNKPVFIPTDIVKFIVYYTYGAPAGSHPDMIIVEGQFEILGIIEAFEFTDPDISDTVVASLSGIDSLILKNNTSPAYLVSTRNITYELNGTIFDIVISDGNFEVDVPVMVIVTALMTQPSEVVVPTSTVIFTSTISSMSTSTVTPTSTDDPTDFINTPLGIAILIVGSVMFFAFVFFIFCLICFCYQRYRNEQDSKKR